MSQNVKLLGKAMLLLSLALNLESSVLVAASQCIRGPYSSYLPLSAYSPALSYCSSRFPAPAVTSTVTVTSTSVVPALATVTTTTTATTDTTETSTSTTITTTTSITETTTTSTSTDFISTTTVGVPEIELRAEPERLEKRDYCTEGQKFTGVNSRTCRVSCGQSKPGTIYKRVRRDSSSGCATSCAKDGKCVSAQYRTDTGICYLQKTSPKSSSRSSKINSVTCQSLDSLFTQLKKQGRDCNSQACACINTPKPRTVLKTKVIKTVSTSTRTIPATATTTTTSTTRTTTTTTTTSTTETTSITATTTTTTDTLTTTNSQCSAAYTSFNGIANDCNRSDGIARVTPTADVRPAFYAIFNGQGVTEDPDNPANNGPQKSETFDDIPATNNCDAIDRCANFCIPSTDIYEQYWSFDLHYFCLAGVWECQCWNDVRYTSDDFTVINPLISQAYGYCAFFD